MFVCCNCSSLERLMLTIRVPTLKNMSIMMTMQNDDEEYSDDDDKLFVCNNCFLPVCSVQRREK